MDGKPHGTVEALEEQIAKIRALRQRWADGGDLTDEERPRRQITLELLDGVLEDLLARRGRLAHPVR